MISSPPRRLITWPSSAAATVQFTCPATAAVGIRLRIAAAFGIVFPWSHSVCPSGDRLFVHMYMYAVQPALHCVMKSGSVSPSCGD